MKQKLGHSLFVWATRPAATGLSLSQMKVNHDAEELPRADE